MRKHLNANEAELYIRRRAQAIVAALLVAGLMVMAAQAPVPAETYADWTAPTETSQPEGNVFEYS